MDLILGNPAGVWALLGIPVLLLIHLLRQRPRRVRVSTLFLLDALRPEGRGGWVLSRLRSSAPLWLQVLAVAVLSALLVEPRWIVEGSAQRVVLVLDGSASMSVFRDAALVELREQLAALEGAASRSEWIALDSDIDRGTLYGGTDRVALLDVLDKVWTPARPDHDMEPALRMALRLAGSSGLALFVTDRARAVPEGVALLATGEARDNLGIAGVRLDSEGSGVWSARVRSYAATPQSRRFWVEIDGQRGPEQRVELAPDAAQLLRGVLPEGATSLALRLEPDAFPLDDVALALRPETKRLAVFVAPELREVEPLARLLGALPRVEIVREQASADLVLLTASVSALPEVDRASIVFLRGSDAQASTGDVVVLPDSLADGLSWEALVCRHAQRSALASDERAVLWRGALPLLSLREVGASRQLLVNLDLERCNAGRLPAFVVALGRFVASVRERAVGYEARNVETGQRLRVAAEVGGGDVGIRSAGADPQLLASDGRVELRAPDAPGLFEVAQGERVLLRGAARFADVREADLRGAGRADPSERLVRERALRNSRQDPLRGLWMCLLVGLLLANWWLLGAQS